MAGAAAPRPQIMTVSDAAATQIKTIMADKPQTVALKIGLKKGGCAGMEYTLDWAEEVGQFDEVVESNGVKVLIDPWPLCICSARRWTTKSTSSLRSSFSTIPTRRPHVDAASRLS